MDYIKDREIKKLEKTLDKKERMKLDKSDSIVVGYQYHPPLEVLRTEEKKTFNKVKEDRYIENMINSCIFIYNDVKFEVNDEDWSKFKQTILDYLMSLNHPLEYSKCILKIVEDLFAHSKNKTININNLIENVILLSEIGYNIEDLFEVKQNLIANIGQKVVNLDDYKRR